MRKFLLSFLTIIQILLFSGIFVIEKLSHKYMTMMRIALYKNRTWEAELPIDTLLWSSKAILIALAALAVLFLLISVVKTKAFRFYYHFPILALAVLAGGTSAFIIMSSVDTMRTYYVAIMLLLGITAIQLIKVPIFLYSYKST